MSYGLRLLADTSVLIEPPTEEEIEAHGLAEAEQAISTMSIAELHLGVLVAADHEQRGHRLRRLAAIEARLEALALDSPSARCLGAYMAKARHARRSLRVRDAIIAATAEAHGLTVLSRDDDFERFDCELISLGAAHDGHEPGR